MKSGFLKPVHRHERLFLFTWIGICTVLCLGVFLYPTQILVKSAIRVAPGVQVLTPAAQFPVEQFSKLVSDIYAPKALISLGQEGMSSSQLSQFDNYKVVLSGTVLVLQNLGTSATVAEFVKFQRLILDQIYQNRAS